MADDKKEKKAKRKALELAALGEAEEAASEKKAKRKKKDQAIEKEAEAEEIVPEKKPKKEKNSKQVPDEEEEGVPERKKKHKAVKEVGENEKDVEEAARERKSKNKSAKGQATKVEEDDDDEPFVVKKAAAVESQEEEVFCAFVGGLRSHVDEKQIWVDFGECGTVKDVILSRWPEDNSSRGMAFITFEGKAALDKCLEWHDSHYEGSWIRVERKVGGVKKKADRGLGGQRGSKPEGCKAVAVLNLSKQAVDDDVWNFFASCGTIVNVKIPKDRFTYESRGMAFVDFENTFDTDKAVKMTGQSLAGQAVRVEYAAPKNDRAAGGRGGGNGGHESPRTKPEGCTSVVVRNLSKTTSEEELWKLIKDCKSANNVSIMFDRDTFESRGIAFIDFDDTDDTDKAVALTGKTLHGMAVRIDYKQPR